MSVEKKRSLMILFVVPLLAILIALAGSDGGIKINGVAVFIASAIFIFVLQWLAFIPAYLLQTERFYDLIGSITYISVIVIAISQLGIVDTRSLVLASLVVVWAIRLGSFLFLRICQDGHDSRFNDIKGDPLRFLSAWTLQGLWILVTVGAALAAITSSANVPFEWFGVFGTVLWIFGFLIESIADYQKRAFRKLQTGQHGFIQSGLWAYSRHPNYFGEILLWTGIAIIAFPGLHGWQLITLVSPLFVILLLTKVSGIPLLEAKADERWQANQDYQDYKKRTPMLIPKLPKPSN